MADRRACAQQLLSCLLPLFALQRRESAGGDGAVVLRVAAADARLGGAALRVILYVLVLLLAERGSRSFLGARRRSLVWDL